VEPVLRLLPSPSGRDRESTDEERLVRGLRAQEPWAAQALARQYGAHVRKVLYRVLGGSDGEAADLGQETFLRALRGIDQLEDPRALKAWLTHVAVFTARSEIRRRRRRRWVPFAAAPEPHTSWAGPELQDAAEAVYCVLDRMPEDERLAYSLRTLMGLELDEAAAACGMSFSTLRRRLARAERRFFKLAREYEALRPWLESK
jgi:RNA polymerase sigma-70 factor (ECF subfamily)